MLCKGSTIQRGAESRWSGTGRQDEGESFPWGRFYDGSAWSNDGL